MINEKDTEQNKILGIMQKELTIQYLIQLEMAELSK